MVDVSEDTHVDKAEAWDVMAGKNERISILEAEIERLRDGLKDIRDYKGYTRPPHFRRRAHVILNHAGGERDDG